VSEWSQQRRGAKEACYKKVGRGQGCFAGGKGCAFAACRGFSVLRCQSFSPDVCLWLFLCLLFVQGSLFTQMLERTSACRP